MRLVTLCSVYDLPDCRHPLPLKKNKSDHPHTHTHTTPTAAPARTAPAGAGVGAAAAWAAWGASPSTRAPALLPSCTCQGGFSGPTRRGSGGCGRSGGGRRRRCVRAWGVGIVGWNGMGWVWLQIPPNTHTMSKPARPHHQLNQHTPPTATISKQRRAARAAERARHAEEDRARAARIAEKYVCVLVCILTPSSVSVVPYTH